MNQLTTFTYRDLIETVQEFEKANLLNLDMAVALRVGGGTQTKSVTGYLLSQEGLVLTISGNEQSFTPRKKKAKAVPASLQAKVGPAEPA